jgi:hypothetical protein
MLSETEYHSLRHRMGIPPPPEGQFLIGMLSTEMLPESYAACAPFPCKFPVRAAVLLVDYQLRMVWIGSPSEGLWGIGRRSGVSSTSGINAALQIPI